MELRRDVFQAIADPTRREIIQLLSQQPLNLNAVTEHFEISRPAISRHIRILTECGLVTIKLQGRERHCYAELRKLKEVSDWIGQFNALWEHRLESFEKYVYQLKAKRNKHGRKK